MLFLTVNWNFKKCNEAFDDLSKKLDSVYGPAQTGKDYVAFNYWTGANSTLIVLTKLEKNYPMKLYYSKADMEQLFQQALDNYEKPSNGTDNTDVGGL